MIIGQPLEPARLQCAPERRCEQRVIGLRRAGGAQRQLRKLIEDRVELGQRIGPEGVARALGGGLLRLGPPAREPLWGRAVEQEGEAEQLFHRAVDVGLQVHDDPLQPRGIA